MHKNNKEKVKNSGSRSEFLNARYSYGIRESTRKNFRPFIRHQPIPIDLNLHRGNARLPVLNPFYQSMILGRAETLFRNRFLLRQKSS